MNNTKNTVQTTQSTVNTNTPTDYKTHTYTNPHVIKQFKTTTVQVTKTTVQDISK
jgi:hypothetical protein